MSWYADGVSYVAHLNCRQRATVNVWTLTEAMNNVDFHTDKPTQRAAAVSLIILGDAGTKVLENYATFAESHFEA